MLIILSNDCILQLLCLSNVCVAGTYVHEDIAFEFEMWISAEFKLYMIKEF